MQPDVPILFNKLLNWDEIFMTIMGKYMNLQGYVIFFPK